MPSCKITVLKTSFNQELANEYEKPDIGPCTFFSEGQEFIVDKLVHYPENFGCSWAWNNIYTYFTQIMDGKEFTWMKESNTVIASCTDPVRSVMFKLERIEE
jgi:uncharacterized repeat protein (TIGR04076 family)